MRLYQSRQLLECSSARSMRQTGPASIIKSLACRGNCTLYILKVALRNLSNRLARSGTDIVNGLTRTAIDEFSINEQFVLGHSGFSFRKVEIVGQHTSKVSARIPSRFRFSCQNDKIDTNLQIETIYLHHFITVLVYAVGLDALRPYNIFMISLLCVSRLHACHT